MELSIQIYSLIYSFIFGIVFNIIYGLLKKFLIVGNFIKRFIFSLIFMLLVTLAYFLGLLVINHGVVHVYFLLCLLLGIMVMIFLKKRWLTHLWKK